MLDGRMRHRDSTGQEGLLGPGGVQWMTAGRGLIHSELPEQQDGLMHGFQLWVNLPAKNKMIDPWYRDIPSRKFRNSKPMAASLRLIAGSVDNSQQPSSVRIPSRCIWTCIWPPDRKNSSYPGRP
jgi:redox-sensitive bicupin YhaK (pirin superfamily)